MMTALRAHHSFIKFHYQKVVKAQHSLLTRSGFWIPTLSPSPLHTAERQLHTLDVKYGLLFDLKMISEFRQVLQLPVPGQLIDKGQGAGGTFHRGDY